MRLPVPWRRRADVRRILRDERLHLLHVTRNLQAPFLCPEDEVGRGRAGLGLLGLSGQAVA